MNAEHHDLTAFLSSAIPSGRCHLYLPRFSGGAVDLPAPSGQLQYGGKAFADRDAKAALRISSLVATVLSPGCVELSDAADLLNEPGFPGGFLFGSRSNPTTPLHSSWFGTRPVRFEFGADWTVVWGHGGAQRFSMPDPSHLERDEYERQIDYGVVARMTSPASGAAAFVVAGLGGRATEGCAIYLAQHWKDLHVTYGVSDFCVLLQFLPPIDPQRYHVLLEATI